MKHILIDALVDSAEMIPFLLFIYFVVGWLEYQYGVSISSRIQRAAKAGPLIGAVFGSIPQCGFSVLASAMYTRRLITIGTLLAVYLATSDEAIPVIMAQPSKAWVVLPLIGCKVAMAIVGGYAVDLIFRSYKKRTIVDDDHVMEAMDGLDDKGCCEHHVGGESRMRELLVHPLVHTLKVFFFVFAVSVGLNYFIASQGHHFGRLLLKGSPLQPVITGFFGLIPNCATSVAMTEIYLKGGISFGAAISGLSASGGLGLLVLLKENHNARDTAKVLGLLLGISIAAGILIQHFYG